MSATSPPSVRVLLSWFPPVFSIHYLNFVANSLLFWLSDLLGDHPLSRCHPPKISLRERSKEVKVTVASLLEGLRDNHDPSLVASLFRPSIKVCAELTLEQLVEVVEAFASHPGLRELEVYRRLLGDVPRAVCEANMVNPICIAKLIKAMGRLGVTSAKYPALAFIFLFDLILILISGLVSAFFSTFWGYICLVYFT